MLYYKKGDRRLWCLRIIRRFYNFTFLRTDVAGHAAEVSARDHASVPADVTAIVNVSVNLAVAVLIVHPRKNADGTSHWHMYNLYS